MNNLEHGKCPLPHMRVKTAKIRLCIRPVWSGHSLCAYRINCIDRQKKTKHHWSFSVSMSPLPWAKARTLRIVSLICPISVNVLLFGNSTESYENNVKFSRQFIITLHKESVFNLTFSWHSFPHCWVMWILVLWYQWDRSKESQIYLVSSRTTD